MDQWISRSVDQLINWLKCVFAAWTALGWFCQICVLVIRLWFMYFWSIHSLLLQLLLSRHRHHPLLCLLYNSVCPWFVWWEVFLLRPRFFVWSNLNYNCTVLMTCADINLKHFKHREWWNRNSFSLVRATSAILPQQSCALNILNVFLKILLLLGAEHWFLSCCFSFYNEVNILLSH